MHSLNADLISARSSHCVGPAPRGFLADVCRSFAACLHRDFEITQRLRLDRSNGRLIVDRLLHQKQDRIKMDILTRALLTHSKSTIGDRRSLQQYLHILGSLDQLSSRTDGWNDDVKLVHEICSSHVRAPSSPSRSTARPNTIDQVLKIFSACNHTHVVESDDRSMFYADDAREDER